MSQQDPNKPTPDPYARPAGPAPEGTPAPGAAPTQSPYAGYPGQESYGQPGQPGHPARPGYPAQPGAPVYPGQPGDVDPGRGLGIAGFVLAFFVPLVGIILSAIALSKSRRAGRKNPLAAWGLGLSIFFTVAGAAVIIGFFASHGDDIADAVQGAGDPTTRKFCQADAQLTKEMNKLQDPSSMETQDYAQGLLDAKDDLDGVVAPDEIATDWKSVVSFFDKIVAPLEGVDTSDEAAVKQALASSGLTQADLTAVQGAGQRVDDWASTHCAAVPVD